MFFLFLKLLAYSLRKFTNSEQNKTELTPSSINEECASTHGKLLKVLFPLCWFTSFISVGSPTIQNFGLGFIFFKKKG